MAAVVSALAMIASFWVQYYDLDQAHDTDHGLQDDDGASVGGYKSSEARLEKGDFMSASMKRSKSMRREAKIS